MSNQTFDFIAHIHRHMQFSERTFGPGPRPAGVIDHIRKELLEIEAAPDDLEEWIDVLMLALDGAWRSGATPEQIVAQLVAKQTKNEGRTWPDWRAVGQDKAIEHVRDGEQPDLQAKVDLLRRALVGMVGTDDPAELEVMRGLVQAMGLTPERTAEGLGPIEALLTVRP